MKIKNFIIIFFAAVPVLFEGFFGISNLVAFFIQIILLAIFGASILYMFSKKVKFWDLVKRLLVSISVFVGVILCLFLGVVFYNNVVPGKLSDIVISNGKQTVQFLQMSHIATEKFYEEKKDIIQKLEKQGYIFLMEGVKPGTKENEKKLSRSLGFDFTPTLYKNIANFIGLKAQDNTDLFVGVSSGSLISVDISIDDLVGELGTGATQNDIVNIEEQLKALDTISDRERILASFVMRAVMNLTLKQAATLDEVVLLEADPKLVEAIINRRNAAIVQYIKAHPEKKIAVVYGALHFNGVFASLQEGDPKWKILSVTSYTPYND